MVDEGESSLIADFSELFSPSSSSSRRVSNPHKGGYEGGYEVIADQSVRLSLEEAATRAAVAALQSFTAEYFYNATKKSVQQHSEKSAALLDRLAVFMPLNFAHPLLLLLISKQADPDSDGNVADSIDMSLLVSIAIAQCAAHSDAIDGPMHSYLIQLENMVATAFGKQCISNTLDSFCSLLVDSNELSDISDSSLKISLLLMANRYDDATAVVVALVASVLKILDTSTALSQASDTATTSDGGRRGGRENADWRQILCLVLMVQLKAVTAMMETTICDAGGGSALLGRMLQFSAAITATLPVIDVAVRIALFLASMHHRADVTLCLLRYPPQYDFSLYALLADVAAGATPDALRAYALSSGSGNSSGSGSGKKNRPGARITSPEELFGSKSCDDSPQTPALPHCYFVSRVEAVDALSPLSSGAFLLRPHETQGGLCFLSFRGSRDGEVKHAVIRRDSPPAVGSSSISSSSVHRFRCGKIDACQSLDEVLQTISRAVPGGLLFDGSSVQRAVAGVMSDKANATGARRVDSNHVFWSVARSRLVFSRGVDFGAAFPSSSSSSSADDSSDDLGSGDKPPLTRIASRSHNHSDRCSEAAANDSSSPVREWSDPVLQTYSRTNAELISNIVASLSLKTLYKQLLAQYSKLKEFFRSQRGVAKVLLQEAVAASLQRSVSIAYCLDISADSDLVLQPVLLAMLRSCCRLSSPLAEAIAPLPPAATAHHPLQGRAEGELGADAFVCMMMKSIKSKVIKQASPSGVELVFEVFDVADVTQWLHMVVERLSQQVGTQEGDKSGDALGVVEDSRGRRGRAGSARARRHRPKSSSGRRGIGKAINAITASAAERLNELVRSRVGMTASSSSSDLLFGTAQAAVVVTDMPAALASLNALWPSITGCSSRSSSLLAEANVKELAERVLKWLRTQARVLRLHTRPPENSFQAAQVFVRYADAWAVSVTSDEQLSGTLILGRHRYEPVTSESSQNTAIFAQFMLDGMSATFKGNEFSAAAFERLWEALRGEAWVVSSLATARPPGAPFRKDSRPALYTDALSRHVYRNALFARMGIPNRFTAHITVDVFGLKDVALDAARDGRALAATPSLDLYMVARLAKEPTARGAPEGPTGGLSGKLFTEGTACASAHKAAAVRSTERRNYTEFAWRDQVCLSFALPEGLLTLPSVEPGDHHTSTAHSARFTTESANLANFTHPTVLQISIFEKSFFADTKLGDLELPLHCLSDENQFREWLPLSTSPRPQKSSSWFVNVQAQLRFHPMALCADAPMGDPGGGSPRSGERGYSSHINDHM